MRRYGERSTERGDPLFQYSSLRTPYSSLRTSYSSLRTQYTTMVDLRSDTVTRPDEGMRRAMYEAEVGDDAYAEDPSVNQLEAEVADLLGKEAAVFVPSGTMGNQLGLLVHTRRGAEVVLERGCHIFNHEGGAGAWLSGRALPARLRQCHRNAPPPR